MRLGQSEESQIKSCLLPALILLLSLSLQVGYVQAFSETIVGIVPSANSANICETFTTNITIENVQNLYGLEITLRWDQTVLRAISVDVRTGQPNGVLYPPIFTVEDDLTQSQGKYSYAATSTAPALSFNGSGIIVKVTFNVTSIGSCSLDLESQLYDFPPPDRWPSISLPIDHVTIGGSFTVIPEFPNVTLLLSLMLLTTLAFTFPRFLRKLRRKPSDLGSPNKIY